MFDNNNVLYSIEQQQRSDRQGALGPDANAPFADTSDAVRRLVRYHCLDEPVFSESDLHKADEIFEATARHLLDKNAQMLNKYKYLLLMESMVSAMFHDPERILSVMNVKRTTFETLVAWVENTLVLYLS